MNSEGKAPTSICNLSALAASRLSGQLKREVLGRPDYRDHDQKHDAQRCVPLSIPNTPS